MKAVISNRIFFRPTSTAHTKELLDKLTYKIETKGGKSGKFKVVEYIKNYKLLLNGVISIPQGRTDLIPPGWEIEDKRILHPVPFPEPKFPLREGQQVVYDEVNDSCFINALVGWGKTFTALYVARKLGQKTLVITHTTILRDQWAEEVRNLFGMEPGIIGAGKVRHEDCAITIGNVQTVVKHIDKLAKEFGTIILDEAHHVPATTFSNIIDGMHARYRIALSGTMERTDGKHVIFSDYFGFNVFKPPQSHTLNPRVTLVKTGIHLPTGAAWVTKINTLLYDPDYQRLIAIAALAQMEKGHSVLIVADRTEFLIKIQELIGESCVLITGNTSYEDRQKYIQQVESGEKMCVAGSRQIFSEGTSINILSCVILAVPTSNPILLEQLIGRIMRLHPGKPEPLVLDMQFASGAERRQNNLRLSFYLNKGWKINEL